MKTSINQFKQSGGFSVLIVITLLACMAVLIAANSQAIHLFKKELLLLDHAQQQKYGQGVRH